MVNSSSDIWVPVPATRHSSSSRILGFSLLGSSVPRHTHVAFPWMAGYLKHPKAAHEAFYDSLPKLSFGRIFEQVWVLGSSANNKLCFIYFFGEVRKTLHQIFKVGLCLNKRKKSIFDHPTIV